MNEIIKIAFEDYDNKQLNTIAACVSDLRLLSKIQKILKNFNRTQKEIRELMNYVIIFMNVFPKKAKIIMLHKTDKKYHKKLNSVLYILGYIEDVSIVEIDKELLIDLSKIKRK